ncbi:MAG: hypothetical protein GX483_07665 [Actinomycetaceae bacterium]|nr:hypothetical protein [Actinomycetaceae bacterium]
MRLQRSLQNAAVGIFGQLFSVVLNFLTRMVFVRTLSQEYLGIEGLFSSLLLMLSLAELGIGSAIIYSLYEPLAKKNRPQIRALMDLYRKAYWTIALIVGVTGLLLSFKLQWFIKEMPDIPNLQLYFLIFVANTAVSYLYSYKGSLIQADQKQYIVSLWQYGFTLLMCVTQITILLLFESYLGFLLTMLAATFFQNFSISLVTDRMYPFLKDKEPLEKIEPDTLDKIKKNTFALVLHKVAGIASTPTTNLILSTFIGLQVVAVYANYLLFTNALQRLIDKVFDAAVASVGNLGVTAGRDRQLAVFNVALYINAFLGALVAVPLLAVFANAMYLFFGESYVFEFHIELAIVALFFLKTIRTAALSFTSAFGLYWFTRWKAVIETIVLVLLSLVAAQYFGIVGILVANSFTSLFVSGAIEGYMLFKHGFKVSSVSYFARVLGYSIGTLALAIGVHFALAAVGTTTLFTLLLRGILAVLVTVIVFVAATCWLPEFKQFKAFVTQALALIFRRRKNNE